MTDALTYSGISADSRMVKPGYLFLAYPGVHSDGRDYIAQAIEAGAIGAGGSAAGGVAAVATAHHHLQGGEQIGQGAHRGGLAGTAVTQRQNAADLGVDGHDLDGEFHLVLTDDGGEGEGDSHGVILSNAPRGAPVIELL